jgi:hypothetical protein
MAQGEMKTADQQSKLPWQIEWIWHVHRLHPIDYLNDCKQLSDGLVDKKALRLMQKHSKKNKSNSKFLFINSYSFIPSIDLTSAVIRQNDFLNKFRRHFLYSYDLKQWKGPKFQHFVQDYVSFIKLARKNQMIVPTFDIDLIWHTHMRYPTQYHEFSQALCGFILDHDDSIETYILSDAYQITADRWKQTYHSEYGQNIDRKHLQRSQDISSYAIVSGPAFVSTTSERPSHSEFQGGSGSGWAYAAGNWDVGNADEGYDDHGTLSIEQNLSQFIDYSF